MDTNLAIPLDSTRCKVIFDYFLDKSLLVVYLLALMYQFIFLQWITHTVNILLIYS
jgi:hypothetical protein